MEVTGRGSVRLNERLGLPWDFWAPAFAARLVSKADVRAERQESARRELKSSELWPGAKVERVEPELATPGTETVEHEGRNAIL